MARFYLTIHIDTMILASQPSESLNIAKKVNGVFTTAFHGASMRPTGRQQQLLQVNKFAWDEQYAVLLAKKYEAGMQVAATTLPKEIRFGQIVTYDRGVLSEGENAPPDLFQGENNATNSFVLANVPENMHAAVSCKVGGEWAPIYVDNMRHSGVQSKLLTPLNEYALFWDRTIPNSMIDYSRTSEPYIFQFPAKKTTLALRYGFKVANRPQPVEEPAWYSAE